MKKTLQKKKYKIIKLKEAVHICENKQNLERIKQKYKKIPKTACIIKILLSNISHHQLL
jgi:hypothetical protein